MISTITLYSGKSSPYKVFGIPKSGVESRVQKSNQVGGASNDLSPSPWLATSVPSCGLRYFSLVAGCLLSRDLGSLDNFRVSGSDSVASDVETTLSAWKPSVISTTSLSGSLSFGVRE